MKLSAGREQLLNSLQVASRAVSTRSAIQALGGILLQTSDGRAELRATDMEIGLAVPLEASVESDGSVVLPGRLLVEVVRALPEGTVAIEGRATERDAEIVCGSARFHIRALPGDDFPKLPAASADSAISLPTQAFVSIVDRVARSASRDDARPILTGIHVTTDGTRLTMAATDSYRLAVMSTELEEAVDTGFEANIPARALRELSRLATQEAPERIELSLLSNQVVFTVGETILTSRLIEGQFPNYRQLLPETFEHDVRLNREELLDVVRRISLMAQKNAPLKMAFREGELTVSATTPDVGEASESLPVGFSGDDLEIGFNPEFLRDGIETAEAEEVVLRLISALRPGLIEPVGDDEYRYLAMPIRLNA